MNRFYVVPMTTRFFTVAKQTSAIVSAMQKNEFSDGKLLFAYRSCALKSHLLRCFRSEGVDRKLADKKAKNGAAEFIRCQKEHLHTSILFNNGSKELKSVLQADSAEYCPSNTHYFDALACVGKYVKLHDKEFSDLIRAYEKETNCPVNRQDYKEIRHECAAEAIYLSSFYPRAISTNEKDKEEKEEEKKKVGKLVLVYPQLMYDENKFVQHFAKIMTDLHEKERFEIKMI